MFARLSAVRVFIAITLMIGALGACWKDPTLPSLFPAPAFHLTDQDGRPVDRESLRGKVWIANFMFTSCPDVCPLLTARLSSVRTQLAAERAQTRFVSFSVDPEHDNVAALKKYATERGADMPDWRFLTGPIESVSQVIVAGFKQARQVNAAEPGKERTILHGSHFVLVDGDAVVRGFYPTDAEGLLRLVRDARILVAHQKRG